ncbi:MAG: thiamine-phosphate pyrophosphorylase [Proteobacteria bacterium]|nr:thiamine-phosphate pyrophosphorylase [Pseudomonadota bacterium]
MTEANALRGLYAITPDGLSGERLIEQVDGALRGGVKLIQYRDKQRDAAQQAEIARRLRALCQRYGARLIVNDNLQLAIDVDADGLHLGGADGDLAAARRALGTGKLLGASCYANFELARQALAAGADYVAFGAVYRSPTKPAAPLAPHQLFARCRAELGVPSCAIGGITAANGAALVAAGADLLAVISDLFEAPDISARAADFNRLFAGEAT